MTKNDTNQEPGSGSTSCSATSQDLALHTLKAACEKLKGKYTFDGPNSPNNNRVHGAIKLVEHLIKQLEQNSKDKPQA